MADQLAGRPKSASVSRPASAMSGTPSSLFDFDLLDLGDATDVNSPIAGTAARTLAPVAATPAAGAPVSSLIPQISPSSSSLSFSAAGGESRSSPAMTALRGNRPRGMSAPLAPSSASSSTHTLNGLTIATGLISPGGSGSGVLFSPSQVRPQTPTERIMASIMEMSKASTAMLVNAASGSMASGTGGSAIVPRILEDNADERVLFCIDLHDENGRALNPGESGRSRLDETKELLKRFIYLKQIIKPTHQFGIITLESKAQLYLAPTRDREFLATAIDNLITTGSYLQFDMASVFAVIDELMEVERHPQDVFRIVMLYSRSNVFPDASSNQAMERLYATGRVHLDLVYIHDPPSDSSYPQEIYNSFVSFRVPPATGQSWFFEVSRSWKRLATSLTKLLAHPSQRLNLQSDVK
ncbi:hypothetical protein BC828DRAFT_407758 [Blastocladiella britannica]|nr:hypothetical protein BC828DRAFT_407758 [Blastocladiella britannica]